MTTAQIDRSITDMIRSASFVYVETAIPAGVTIAEYRRARRAPQPSMLRRMEGRYPDDPVGDYETTDGGW